MYNLNVLKHNFILILELDGFTFSNHLLKIKTLN